MRKKKNSTTAITSPSIITEVYHQKHFLFGPLENTKTSREQDQISGSALTVRNILICTAKKLIQNTVFSI